MTPFFTDEGLVFCSHCGALAESDPVSSWKLSCPNGHGATELQVDAGPESAQGVLAPADEGGEYAHAEVPPEPEPA